MLATHLKKPLLDTVSISDIICNCTDSLPLTASLLTPPSLSFTLSLSLSCIHTHKLTLSLSQTHTHFFLTLTLSLSLSLCHFSYLVFNSHTGDRYSAEPRSKAKSAKPITSSHYDEDPRGPIGEYHDDENGFKEEIHVGDEHRTAPQR